MTEPESLKELVARLLLEQLDEGLLEKLRRAAQMPASQHVQLQGIPSEEAFGTMTVTGGMGAQLQPTSAAFEGNVVEEIREVSPKLAEEIENQGAQDRTALLNLWTALIQLLGAAVTAWHILSPHPPPPQHIEQICINTINCVVNVPPGHN